MPNIERGLDCPEAENSTLTALSAIATEIRRSAFSTIEHAGSGHLGSCSSSAEMLSALYFGGILNYDIDDPKHPLRDRVILRGHLGPARYTVFSMLEWIDKEKLQHYRQLGGLPGHEEMELPGVDITPTGSLGMGLSYGAGAALAAKLRGENFKTYVFLGDGEEQEGSVSEAARHIATLGLDNLVCILDKNGKQLSRDTMHSDGNTNLLKLWESYGWEVVEIQDGNNINQVVEVFEKTKVSKQMKPVIVIAHTTKGLGIPGATESFNGYHTVGSCPTEDLRTAVVNQTNKLKSFGYTPDQIWTVAKNLALQNHLPEVPKLPNVEFTINIEPKEESMSGMMHALEHYRKELSKIMHIDGNKHLISMTADLMKASLVEKYDFTPPVIHIDTGIREQHMLAMAYGMSLTDPDARILINYAEMTAYRGADQFNSIALGKGALVVLSEGGGLSGSRDGLNHELSGIPGMLLTLPGIRILEPADVRDVYNCLNESLTAYSVPTYIRTHWRTIESLDRNPDNLKTTTYYEVSPFKGPADIVLISCGLTMQGALEAKRLLVTKGIKARLINVIDLKSLDENFAGLVDEGAPVLTIYNGNEFILRAAVTAALTSVERKKSTLVRGHGFEMGDTGTLNDLIKHFKFDGEGIVSIIMEKFPNLF